MSRELAAAPCLIPSSGCSHLLEGRPLRRWRVALLQALGTLAGPEVGPIQMHPRPWKVEKFKLSMSLRATLEVQKGLAPAAILELLEDRTAYWLWSQGRFKASYFVSLDLTWFHWGSARRATLHRCVARSRREWCDLACEGSKFLFHSEHLSPGQVGPPKLRP